MSVLTEAQRLAADLLAALAAPPATDAFNQLHLVSLRDSLRNRLPGVLARLESCRENPQADEAQIRAAIDELTALQAQATAGPRE